jgi:hypothetical protein
MQRQQVMWQHQSVVNTQVSQDESYMTVIAESRLYVWLGHESMGSFRGTDQEKEI